MDSLRRALRGLVITPDNPEYDPARQVWNAAVDAHPAVIVRCLCADDARLAVMFARRHALPVSIRGGGHSIAGHCVGPDSVMVDLSMMRDVSIDSAARTLTVDGGATWADVLRAAQPFGLGTPGGFNPDVGVAGLTLGGGYGALTRMHGLACDNLIDAEVIDATGSIRCVDEQSSPGLFWAMRGAGANFGIATRLRFRLHAPPPPLAGKVYYPLSECAAVLRGYRQLSAELPDQATAYLAIKNAPGEPGIIFIAAVYFGAATVGASLLAPFARLGKPLAADMRECSYVDLHATTGEGFPGGYGNAWKALFVRSLDDLTLERMTEYATRTDGRDFYMVLEQLGGDMARRSSDATAFPHRDAAFGIAIAVKWKDPSEGEVLKAHTEALHEALQPVASGVYVNYVGGDPSEAEIESAYGGNLPRLRRLKHQFDPENLFRFNTNIRPA